MLYSYLLTQSIYSRLHIDIQDDLDVEYILEIYLAVAGSCSYKYKLKLGIIMIMSISISILK